MGRRLPRNSERCCYILKRHTPPPKEGGVFVSRNAGLARLPNGLRHLQFSFFNSTRRFLARFASELFGTSGTAGISARGHAIRGNAMRHKPRLHGIGARARQLHVVRPCADIVGVTADLGLVGRIRHELRQQLIPDRLGIRLDEIDLLKSKLMP
jgi:hypothetical protein